jgi:hypothetical protein
MEEADKEAESLRGAEGAEEGKVRIVGVTKGTRKE